MGKLSELLTLAQQRGHALGLPYAGALTPQEAFDLLRLAPGARLVDVRTRAIQRKLRDVQDLPAPDTAVPLARGHTAALTGLDPEDDLT